MSGKLTDSVGTGFSPSLSHVRDSKAFPYALDEVTTRALSFHWHVKAFDLILYVD